MLHVPNRREPEPWARTWVVESARAQFARDPWRVPAIARFALGFCLGVAILEPCLSLVLRVL